MTPLKDEARRLGVTLKSFRFNDSTRGLYDHESRTILFNVRLLTDQRCETIGHELGHAYYGHTCSSTVNELQADRRGALLQVDPDIYSQLATYSTHPGYLAQEMGLTPFVIETWQSWWLPQLASKYDQFTEVA